ncbi:hypothetical protein AB0H03_06550 [Streptomyces sparsogenes]|uniref:hypothetical protein n=1 Tax=Streptomyces sparsogenes TaxID=67365 RepID=UPI0033E60A03
MRERAETAERNVKTEQFARNTMARQCAEKDAANTRLQGRVRHLTELLASRGEQGDAETRRLKTRLENMRATVRKYRKDMDGQTRLIRSQQGLLDRLYGLDTPAVAEGENWQQRRHDRMPGVTL